MYSVTRDLSLANGTSYKSSIQLVYSDIVRAFGEPVEFDEYKVSGQWTFHDPSTGAVFTLYDWKSTSLYSSDLPSVTEFRSSSTPAIFNIGGNGIGDVNEFKTLLLKQIEYAKKHEAEIEIALVGFASPYIKTGNE